MIKLFDTEYLSDEICEKIINEYSSKVTLIKSNIRSQKNYHERDKKSWLYTYIDKFIKINIGNNFQLIERVTVLRYDKGDYFIEHVDGPHNKGMNSTLPPHFYGGVELNNKSEFEGGEFFIKGNNVSFKKGRMFTHGFSDSHGVTKINRGVRWSIHFLIKNNKINLI